MTKHLLVPLALFLLAFHGFSQVNIQVIEEVKQMSLGEKPAFIVDIPSGDFETVRKAWIAFLEKGSKLKVSQTSDEMIITGAVFKKITLDSVNVFSSIYQIDTNIRLIAFFELDSIFISTGEGSAHEKEISASFKTAVRDFALEQYRLVYDQQIDVQNDLLGDLEKERGSLVNEIEKNQKTIKENEENIRQSEDAISVIESDLDFKDKEIADKKISIAPLKKTDPDNYKLGEKELSAMEKEKKKLENDRKKENNDIVKYKNNISDAERSIEQLEEQTEGLDLKIEEQEDLISRLESEKSRIK